MVWYNRFLFNFLDCNINNIMEDFIMEEELMSNCCIAPFVYPGWPDSDICSTCKEHADIEENE